MALQRQIQTQMQRPIERIDTMSLLAQRSESVMALKAPYTILVKARGHGIYDWIAYSIGRPRNVIWGDLVTHQRQAQELNILGEEGGIGVENGCSWDTLAVVNSLLAERRGAGYAVVATLAKDKFTPRILAAKMMDAYALGTDFQIGRHNIKDVRYAVNIRAEAKGIDILKVSGNVLRDICTDIAAEYLEAPNYLEDLTSGRVPLYVIQTITDYLEHNRTASNTNLPERCPTVAECEDNATSHCDLYRQNFGLL